MNLLLLLAVISQNNMPDLPGIFLGRDRQSFSGLVSEQMRVTTDLRPILQDFGGLAGDQVLMAFDKLMHRYTINNAEVLSSQSDANYAWLEIYLRLDLTDRQRDETYQVTFGFYFKVTSSRMMISRWVVQDIR